MNSSRTNNYFLVPAFRARKKTMVVVPDPRLPAFVPLGDVSYRVLGKYDVSTIVRRADVDSAQRTIAPIRLGVLYLKVEMLVGGIPAERILKCKIDLVEVNGVDDRHDLSNLSLVDPEGDEWLGIKTAKLLEEPNVPKDVDWIRYFFFDDSDAVSTLKAFEGAKRVTSEPAVYRPIKIAGPWGDLPTIGQGIGALEAEPS